MANAYEQQTKGGTLQEPLLASPQPQPQTQSQAATESKAGMTMQSVDLRAVSSPRAVKRATALFQSQQQHHKHQLPVEEYHHEYRYLPLRLRIRHQVWLTLS